MRDGLSRCGFHRARFDGAPLSELERRILHAYACGNSRERIGSLVGLSSRTVGNYLTIAKEKLGADSLVQAAVMSLELPLTAGNSPSISSAAYRRPHARERPGGKSHAGG